MANQFDITPADPLQTQEDFRQSLAKTAFDKNVIAKQQFELQALAQGAEDDKKFREAAAKLSPDMPLSDRTNRLATLAFQSGKLADGEKLLAAAANITNRESQAAMRDQAIALKGAQELEKKIKVYQSVEQMMGESATGWEMGNELVKSQTGEDHPLYAMQKARGQGWSPDVGKALSAGHTKRLTTLQEQLEQARIKELQQRTAREARLTEVQVEEHKARTEAIRERTVAGAKAGAGKLATVTKAEKDAAFRLAKEVHSDADAEHLDRFSDDIAADAKAIQLKDHGSFKDALKEALARNEPNWQKGKSKTVLGYELPGSKSKDVYTPNKKAAKGVPAVGDVVRGYKFEGGDPSKKENWEPAAADTGEE